MFTTMTSHSPCLLLHHLLLFFSPVFPCRGHLLSTHVICQQPSTCCSADILPTATWLTPYSLPPCQQPHYLPLPYDTHCLPSTSPFAPQLRRAASAVYETCTLSRRHQARSRLPPCLDSSRKHHCSCSPHHGHELSSDCLEKRACDNAQCPRFDRLEFFQTGTGPCGRVCAVCLSRREHIFAKCNETKLWDSSPGSAWKNEQGQLVTANGLPLCFDWQVLQGCRSTSHPD